MQAGELRHRIQLQLLTPVQTDAGEDVPTWSTVKTRWAAVQPLQGRELFAAQAENSDVTVRIRIRYMKDLTTDYRMVFRGKSYDINSIIDVDERRIEQLLMCKVTLRDA